MGKIATMEKTITVSEAARKFFELLRAVKEGQTYILTSRGRPVARITPIESNRPSDAKVALLAHLKSLPAQGIGRWTRDELYDD